MLLFTSQHFPSGEANQLFIDLYRFLVSVRLNEHKIRPILGILTYQQS